MATLALAAALPVLGAENHVVTGLVTHLNGAPARGVRVVIGDRSVETGFDGRFSLRWIPAGTHTMVCERGDRIVVRTVQVPVSDKFVVRADWPVVFQDSLTVYAASKRRERLVEAPAAITSVLPSELDAQTSSGQLPRLLEFTPGVQVAQSDLFDFNINTRGFNSSINRRVLTLIDGRQTSVPEFLGVQEWGAVSMPLDEFASVELVRGPSSALYGAGAVAGVLNLTTKSPKDTPGFKLRVSAGELETARIEGRVGGSVGSLWSWRFSGSVQESEHLTVSRVDETEYAPGSLLREAIAPPFDKLRTTFGALRFDRFGRRLSVALEAGTGSFEGGTTLAPLGRTQAERVSRPWARFNINAPGWNLLGFYSGRAGRNQIGLSTGASLYSEGYNTGLELQANREVFATRGLLVGGLAYARQRVDSSDPDGVHGIFADVETADQRAAFGQLNLDLADAVALVVSARLDGSSLHSTRLSARAGLTWAMGDRNRFRATYNDSFQGPTLVEVAVRTPVGPVLDLTPMLAAAGFPDGGALGFDRVPQLALGNDGLGAEEIRSWELGYRGSFGSTLVSVSAYRNELTDFTTSILPQVGTSLGRLNPEFGPYRPPAELSAEAAEALLAALEAGFPGALAFLSNDRDGAPILAVLSLTNFGRATAEGLELEVHRFFADDWQLTLSAAQARFSVEDSPPENPLQPNGPELQAAAGLVGSPGPWTTSIRVRWVEGFEWSAGLFRGPVPSYVVADAHLARDVRSDLRVGFDVANLADNRHYELFGGNLLRRRALLHLTYSME